MSMKSSWMVVLSALLIFVSGTVSEANGRQQKGRGQGTSKQKRTPNSFQNAQNQAKQIAQQQHEVWIAKRRAQAAAKANGDAAAPTKKSSAIKPVPSDSAAPSTPASNSVAK